MEKFKIDFYGKSYNAVELDGSSVELERIVLAEESLDDVLSIYMNSDNSLSNAATEIDDSIFGYAPLELILNGDEEELEGYAEDLL